MNRISELAPFWNWLPAFRAVAETQHLPTAAKELHVTAPALSRSIKLLERHLGYELFQRVGRNIRLTNRGERFLVAVRDGMRRIHDGLADLRDDTFRGAVYILSGSGLIPPYLVNALRDVRRLHPDVQPVVISEPPVDAVKRLLRGELDLAFHTAALNHPDLTTERLGQASNGLYCGPDHPLFKKRNITPEMLAESEFVAPSTSLDSDGDGWPPDLPRKITMRVSHMQMGCEICAQGRLLATLPDVVAQQFSGGRVLRRLPFELLPPTQVFATYRPSLGISTPIDAFLDAVRKHVAGSQKKD